MLKLEAKHPIAIRWMHWVNFPVLFLMIWSGLLIYWADDGYDLKWPSGAVLFHLFPDSWFNARGMDHRLALGRGVHFFFAWVFAVNGIAFVIYNAVSGEWRHLLPNLSTPLQAWHVVLHDLYLRRQPLPRAKFNGAQRIAYSSVIFMGFCSLLTGVAIYLPTTLSPLTSLLGGYYFARVEHFILTMLFLSFFLVHVAQVAKAGWNNFRAMVTGYELVPAEEVAKRG